MARDHDRSTCFAHGRLGERWYVFSAFSSSPALIGVKVGLFDLSQLFNSSVIDDFGLPPLAPGEKLTCGTDPQLSPCSREGTSSSSVRFPVNDHVSILTLRSRVFQHNKRP